MPYCRALDDILPCGASYRHTLSFNLNPNGVPPWQSTTIILVDDNYTFHTGMNDTVIFKTAYGGECITKRFARR